MKILAFDTSSEMLTIALHDGRSVMGMLHEDRGRDHDVCLAAEVKKLMDGKGIAFRELDLVVCGCGPGSFTGIRIGLASLKAFACASGAKALGVGSFTGALHDLPEDAPLVAPLLDARKGKVYSRIYRQTVPGSFRPECGYMLCAWEEIAGRLAEEVLFFGPGVDAYRDRISGCAYARTERGIPYEVRADLLALEACRRIDDLPGEIDAVEPLYLYHDRCAVEK